MATQEDDDLADSAQQLVDQLDVFLRTDKLLAALGDEGYRKILAHRNRVFHALMAYRALNFMTKRRAPRVGVLERRPSSHEMAIIGGPPIALSAASLARLAAPAATSTGAGAALFSASVALLYVASAVFIAVAIGQYTGGSMREVVGRTLGDAVQALARDLLQINALTTLMAITAEEAAKLSTKELYEILLKAANVFQASLGIVIAELVKRFPECAMKLQAFKTASFKANRAKTNPGLGGLRFLPKFVAEQMEAYKQVYECLLSHGFKP